MGSFYYSIPPSERPISEILGRLPPAFKDQAEKGFVVLSELSQQSYALILNAVVVVLEDKNASLDDLAKSLKLSKNDLGGLFAAAMLTVPILGQGANAEEFMASAVKVGLINENLVGKIQPFVDSVVSQKSAIGKAIRRAALPSQVLPAFSSVEFAFDLRIGFEQQVILEAVPVAIVHIETDTRDADIWFQCSKFQILQLKTDIEDAIKKMEAAEAWAGVK